ncbi:hypothetical protein [Ferruginibacter sp. SUN106]|uniref:hypothetical protein n=1 Tax=Ferruginibacter sp. SUN106 TaxID=2978348 RepID=UPI003D36754D
MKLKTTSLVLALSLFVAVANAQTNAPEGYTKATVTLANGTLQPGFIKDNIKKSASVIFTDESGSNKKVYEGSDINGITIDAISFICINGDFFKTICTGKLCFLQKASNASGKASYNGTEAVFNNGTEGKIGDYFVYADKKLKLINKKTVESFISNDLTGCSTAIEKAKTINGDISKLQEAVDIYNSYSVK